MPSIDLPPRRRAAPAGLVTLLLLAAVARPGAPAWGQAGTPIEPLVAPGAAPAQGGPRGRVVPPPRPGRLEAVDVLPGSTVRLDDPAFDPARARYSIDDDDLVVELDNGGTLVLGGFLAQSARSPRLAIGRLAPVPASAILARGTEQALAADAPAAGEAGNGSQPGSVSRGRPRP